MRATLILCVCMHDSVSVDVCVFSILSVAFPCNKTI